VSLKKLIAGNWKMNGSAQSLAELDAIAIAAADVAAEVAICPPVTLIAAAVARQPSLMIGAQDCHWAESGAHTGCLSVAMIRDAGAKCVIVGHSERRADQGERDEDVKVKAAAAISGGLIAIVCVGETEVQRDAGEAITVVTAQIRASIPASGDGATLVVAYEPVWAIGTGRTPSVDEVAEMHAAIRAEIDAVLGNKGIGVRILYGGSVNPSNAAELLHIPNVDGALVGGASLKADDFNAILAAA
jgi:triosephosphate isomerase (TIM)